MKDDVQIRSAEVVLPCRDLDANVRFFTELGFGIDSVLPADAPREIVLSAYGLRMRLVASSADLAHEFRLSCHAPPPEPRREAPNGSTVEFVHADPPLALPPAAREIVISRLRDTTWGTGRAGMEYRDLLPSRLGGRYIASHIRIPRGGPVPDYVHYHRVHFQMIYCVRGSVRLVYEDQGDEFEMHAGDGVLQPPRIRHRVLACSDGLEVVELACPAVHETHADHDLKLPTPTVAHDRVFDGQRFVHHRSSEAPWLASRFDGVLERCTGIAEATAGLARVAVLRADGASSWTETASADLTFGFVLAGAARLAVGGRDEPLGVGDCYSIPCDESYVVTRTSTDLEVLEVAVAATAGSTTPIAHR